MSLQRIMTSSAVRIRAVPPFRIGLSKSTLQDHLEVSVDTITYNYRFVHISALPPAPSGAPDTKAPHRKSLGKANPFPPAKIVLLCLVSISPRHTARVIEGRTPKEKHSFLFQKKFTLAKSEMQGVIFLSGLPSEARRWRGDSSSVRFRSEPPRAPRAVHQSGFCWK